MTPKEKAKELYLKYCPYDICYCDPLGNEIDGYYERYAKTCARICIDELISSHDKWEDNAQWNTEEFYYWTEVKQELEVL